MAPIPGTTRTPRLEENLRAAQIKLSPQEIAEIERAVLEQEVAGERYDQMGLAMVEL